MKTIKYNPVLIALFIGYNVFSQIPTDGLVAFYPFNGNANDVSGNGNNGIISGAILSVDRCDSPDSAYNYDGLNDYIEFPREDFILNEYSYSVWIKVSELPPGYIDGWMIFSPGSSSSGVCQGIGLHPDGGICATSYNIGNNPRGSWAKSPPQVQPGQWVHIVTTRNYEKVQIYINGELMPYVETGTYNPITNNQAANYDNPDTRVILGCRSDMTSHNYFKGSIDDLCIYNRVLTAQEIQQLYFTNCKTLPINELILFYPFTGNANDESGNENHGMINGATLTTDRCDLENRAYSFDGENNYINIGDIPDFDGSDALTISAWIYTDGITDQHSGTIISKYSTYGQSERVFLFDVARYQENSLRFIMYGADGNADWEQEISSVPIQLSVWNHVVVTWDGVTHSIEFYINGSKINSNYSQNGNRPERIYNKSSSVMIGACESGYDSPDYMFNGSIDEILTFTRVLTHEEILSLYYFDCESSGLTAFYPFNGNANDEGGSGNDGQVHGPVLTTDRCGNPNSAYTFDGVNDYISLDPSYITPFSEGTFAAWVYFNTVNSVQYLGCLGDINSQDSYLSLIRLDPQYETLTIFRRNPGFADIIKGSTVLNSGQWYFVVLTSDGNQWNLYVNAEKEDLSIISGNNTGDWAHELTGIDNWLLGGIEIQEPHDPAYLNGKLDDVRFYDYALSVAEIQALYQFECALEISGKMIVCQNEQNVSYTLPYQDNATYDWSFTGTGATITGDANEIQIDFSADATNGDLNAVITGIDLSVTSITLPIIVSYCSSDTDEMNIPNSFSPNGDNINDLFIIGGLKNNTEIKVFNRAGKLIYESNNYNNDWDGTDTDGNKVNTDTYWYIIKIPGIGTTLKGFLYIKI